MSDQSLQTGSLIVYKGSPGIILYAGEKIEIGLEDSRISVRPKDVVLIHPGPIKGLHELDTPGTNISKTDIETAWEILAGEKTNLAELAELISGEFTPISAWAAWKLVRESTYFRGDNPDSILAYSEDEVNKRRDDRLAKEAEENRWRDFISRITERFFLPEDAKYFGEIEDLALGHRDKSRVLNTLGIEERPEAAHAFLLKTGFWDEKINPYPSRLGLDLTIPEFDLPKLRDEDRQDLTHLPAYAIDDEDSLDPDDAISLEGDWKIWVHVADAAVLAPPGSPGDIEARSRGTNLYLPELTVPMLPPETARRLGMGLQDISPALSFGIELNQMGEIQAVEIIPSWVRATRMNYGEASDKLAGHPLSRLYEIAKIYRGRRLASGAVSINLPEVKVRVVGGNVSIFPVLPLPSRTLVSEAMVMAGEAAAVYALQHDIPIPFASQPPAPNPEALSTSPESEDMAGMFVLRRLQNRARVSSHPAPHTGLGLPVYTRVTSPLRRYLDLAAHQQLRLFLLGQAPLDQQEVLARVGESEAITGSAARAENLSRRHWTLVYFLHNPDWRGEGVLVEKRGSQGRVIIPELGFEAQTTIRGNPALNTRIKLALKGVDLPELEAAFHSVLG
jgi:exoribonuclease II